MHAFSVPENRQSFQNSPKLGSINPDHPSATRDRPVSDPPYEKDGAVSERSDAIACDGNRLVEIAACAVYVESILVGRKHDITALTV